MYLCAEHILIWLIPIPPKATCKFDAIPIKPGLITLNNEKKILWKHRQPQIAKSNIENEKKTVGITVPDFKIQH